MRCVEFVIEPEPAEDERAAIVTAIEQLRMSAPRPTGLWGRPEIELVEAQDTWHATRAGPAAAGAAAAPAASAHA